MRPQPQGGFEGRLGPVEEARKGGGGRYRRFNKTRSEEGDIRGLVYEEARKYISGHATWK